MSKSQRAIEMLMAFAIFVSIIATGGSRVWVYAGLVYGFLVIAFNFKIKNNAP